MGVNFYKRGAHVFCGGLLALLGGCNKPDGCDDLLGWGRTDYAGSGMRTDGYYFDAAGGGDRYVDVIFFYRNGVCSATAVDTGKIEDGVPLPDASDQAAKSSKAGWGVYRVAGDAVEIETWTDRPYGCHATLYENGTILNDTTLRITRREWLDDAFARGEEGAEVAHTFRFRRCAPKPDSTNGYIR